MFYFSHLNTLEYIKYQNAFLIISNVSSFGNGLNDSSSTLLMSVISLVQILIFSQYFRQCAVCLYIVFSELVMLLLYGSHNLKTSFIVSASESSKMLYIFDSLLYSSSSVFVFNNLPVGLVSSRTFVCHRLSFLVSDGGVMA